MSECNKKVRELLQICLGQKCINYLANFCLFISTSSQNKKCINYLTKFRLLKRFLFLYTINNLIITILANLHYYKNCINYNILKHAPSKWAMNKPKEYIDQSNDIHTKEMDDSIFLQALVGIKENSLKNKIENTNSENDENDYLNIIKYSSYYEADKFKNHIQNYQTKNYFNVLSSNIQCINSKFNELKIFTEEL